MAVESDSDKWNACGISIASSPQLLTTLHPNSSFMRRQQFKTNTNISYSMHIHILVIKKSIAFALFQSLSSALPSLRFDLKRIIEKSPRRIFTRDLCGIHVTNVQMRGKNCKNSAEFRGYFIPSIHIHNTGRNQMNVS